MFVPQLIKDARRLADFGRYRWQTRSLNLQIPQQPIFAPTDERSFRELLASSEFYLEFGAGASTLIAATKVKTVRSIESDRHFAMATRRALPTSSSDVMIVSPEVGLVGPWGYPVMQRRTKSRLQKWDGYVECGLEAIAKVGRMPDFVLIDGRFRAACALGIAFEAAHRKASVTIQFDDYISRPSYHFIEAYLGTPRPLERAAVFSINRGDLPRAISRRLVADSVKDVL